MYFRCKNKQDLNRMIDKGRAFSFYALSTSGTRTTHDPVLYYESKGALFFKSSTIFSMKNKERKKFIYLFNFFFVMGCSFINGTIAHGWLASWPGIYLVYVYFSVLKIFLKNLKFFIFFLQINMFLVFLDHLICCADIKNDF
jgi:hypothetical protein